MFNEGYILKLYHWTSNSRNTRRQACENHSIINRYRLPNWRSYINIICKYSVSFIIGKFGSYLRQGIPHPWAVLAPLPAVSPVFYFCTLILPCRRRLRRSLAAPSPAAFLYVLRPIETPPKWRSFIILEWAVIIIPKGWGHSDMKIIPKFFIPKCISYFLGCNSVRSFQYSVVRSWEQGTHPIRTAPAQPCITERWLNQLCNAKCQRELTAYS